MIHTIAKAMMRKTPAAAKQPNMSGIFDVSPFELSSLELESSAARIKTEIY